LARDFRGTSKGMRRPLGWIVATIGGGNCGGIFTARQYLSICRWSILGLKDCVSKRILKIVVLIGKLFGRSKGEPVEIKASASFVPEKMFRRATKRIFAKYKVAIRKLGP
jgi:hypothetical protein